MSHHWPGALGDMVVGPSLSWGVNQSRAGLAHLGQVEVNSTGRPRRGAGEANLRMEILALRFPKLGVAGEHPEPLRHQSQGHPQCAGS